jgi:alkylation response protein AidB-like acyl-CoA dehydrogenase
MSMLKRAQVRGEVAYVSRLLRETVDSLMSIGGASAFAQANVLQRYWRDLGVISRHAFLSTNPGLEVYGRALTDQWPIGPM